jgi:hypothetical protein
MFTCERGLTSNRFATLSLAQSAQGYYILLMKIGAFCLWDDV